MPITLGQLLETQTTHTPSPGAVDCPDVSPNASRAGSPRDVAGELGENELNSSDASTSSVITRATQHGRKRPAEDLSGLVRRAAQRARLLGRDVKDLTSFAELSPAERELQQYALSLRLQRKLEQIQPADAIFELPPMLTNKMIVYGSQILLCPETPVYFTASTMLMEIVSRHPRWGYTEEVKNHEAKVKVVILEAQTIMTQGRCKIKNCIAKSVRTNAEQPTMDIVTLTRACISKLEASRLITTKTRADILMCARFAFLRARYLAPNENYWQSVDKELAMLRQKSTDEQSSYFRGILQEDIKRFGDVNMDELGNVAKHHRQIEVEAFATNTQEELKEFDEDEE